MRQADIALDPMAGTLRNLADVPDAFALVDKIEEKRRIGFPKLAASTTVNVSILALDLGTKLGWAVQSRDGALAYGTESFAPRSNWSAGQKWLRVRSWLADTINRHQVHAIAYEDVKRHIGTDAAHAYGAFLALVQMAADSHRLTLMPVGVGTIKKHFTGKGNADKAAMVAEAKRRGFRPHDDNSADALAILSWAIAQERAA